MTRVTLRSRKTNPDRAPKANGTRTKTGRPQLHQLAVSIGDALEESTPEVRAVLTQHTLQQDPKFWAQADETFWKPAASSISDTLDPIRFARSLGFEPDARQTELLLCDSTEAILNCSRQFGKSTICAIKALHTLMAEDEALAVVVSPSDRQSREFVRKAASFVRKLGLKVRGDGDNDVSVMLPNGSRLIGLPGKESTIRGFSSVSMLLIDEAAQVSDELYKAIRPMIAVSNGGIWMMSTPFGRRGFFWETWSKGGREWKRLMVPATDCPRISPAFLAKEKAALGDRQFRQEYLCEFIGDTHALFSEDLIRSLIRTDVLSLSQRRAERGQPIPAATAQESFVVPVRRGPGQFPSGEKG